MMPNIIPYNKANVAIDQPWLVDAEIDTDKIFEEFILDQVSRYSHIDRCVIPDLIARADEGDRYAFQQLYHLHHFILTEDYRIVEEPNFLRWGIFIEKATHRYIDKTTLNIGCPNNPKGPSYRPQETFISTIFIGVGPNELFETMIFGGLLNGVQWRHRTLIDAKMWHWKAVELVHKLNRYMKRHGKAFKKDWLRLEKMFNLSRKRDIQWTAKRLPIFQSICDRLERAPGPPSIPQPNIICDLAQMFIPREKW